MNGVCALPCEYLQHLKEASSKPCSVSSALICRRTCLWRAGLGLCFCWIYSPERAEEGKTEEEKDKAPHLYIFYFMLRAFFLCAIFWVITTLNSKTGFPCGAANEQHTRNKTKKANSDKKTKGRKKALVVFFSVGGCFISLYQSPNIFRYTLAEAAPRI